MSVRIDLLPCASDLLGESPIWDDIQGCLYWVDSVAPCIQRYDPSSGQHDVWQMPTVVGSIGLSRKDGHLITALRDGFYDVDLGAGTTSLIAAPQSLDPVGRFNDGKVDRQGRFVCGTLVPPRHSELGKLYRVDRDGVVACLETGIHISNSLSFSLDGRTMYFADSMQRAIWAYDYVPDTGTVSGKRVLIDTAPLQSGTDGACVDCDGCLWVALVEVGKIARITPNGSVDRTIELPAEFPSCPAFGGDGMSILFVTSIRDTGSGRMKSTRPASGKVMVLTNLGTCGVPEPRFAAARSDPK